MLSKRPRSPQQTKSALVSLIKCSGVVCPVQFIVQVNTWVSVTCHNLSVHSLNVHPCWVGMSAPVEIHHQLFDLCVDLEVVPQAQVHKVLGHTCLYSLSFPSVKGLTIAVFS